LVPDHHKPQALAHQETHLEFSVAREVASPLNTLCRREGATLFMGFLAAFKVLLYRYTGQPDIAVGSPISGRTRAELNDLVGFFLNTLVLRTDMSGNPTFRQVLCRVRETTLQAFAHQDVPIERIVEELEPRRNTTRTPLFEIFFAFESLDADRSHTNGMPVPALTGELVQIATEAKRELTLNIRDLGETLAGSFEYADRLFSEAMINTMIARFCALLAAVARDPDKGILDISLADGTPASNVSSFNIDLRAIEPAFDEA
jgi:non-ribosomal peptide synthetase component F